MIDWKNKRVVVVGLGMSNLPLIRFLLGQGAAVCGRDQKTASELGERYDQLVNLGVECQLGSGYLDGLLGYDAVFLTPGIPKHLPQIQELFGKVPVLGEIALVLAYTRAPIFAITGSSGKTTTTTLVGEMLKASGVDTYVGGNIGKPLIEEIQGISPNARIVLELSSFQLELLTSSPPGALVTNVSENHLDIHQTMENYINAKKQIYRHQRTSDLAVFNYDDVIAREISLEAAGKRYYFSMHTPVECGTYLAGDDLIYRNGEERVIVHRSEISLRGEHNVANMLAAALFAHLAGASWEAIAQVARSFAGVPHRLEKIAEIKGTTYYNDSKATTPAGAIAGINAFTQPLILLAGGYDKRLSFAEFAEVINHKAKDLILFGETAALIREAVEQGESKKTVIHQVDDLAHGVKLASQLSKQGDVVLLSPACASYDMYPNFEVRGDHFRQLVMGLAQDDYNEGE